MKTFFLTALGTALLSACGANSPKTPADPSDVGGGEPRRATQAPERFAAPPGGRAAAGQRRQATAPLSELPGADDEGAAYAPSGRAMAEPESALRPHESRPGLATHWGERRHSPTESAAFERRDRSEPFSVTAFHYDDIDGVVAMTGRYTHAQSRVPMAGGAVVVTLEDGSGRALPAASHGDRMVAVGAPGSRYQIRISNQTGRRFEVVASVDGLDVIDGDDASFEKRGYLVGPWASVEIEGFRRSEDAVAAFRFGDVDGSYASARGRGRDVGVIGVALFDERHDEAFERRVIRHPDEIYRRETADPFPGRFAPPPEPSFWVR